MVLTVGVFVTASASQDKSAVETTEGDLKESMDQLEVDDMLEVMRRVDNAFVLDFELEVTGFCDEGTCETKIVGVAT